MFLPCKRHRRIRNLIRKYEKLTSLGFYFCEEQRSHFVVISVKIKESIKNIFPIPWCSFTSFKNNVKLDPILRQPKEFLR